MDGKSTREFALTTNLEVQVLQNKIGMQTFLFVCVFNHEIEDLSLLDLCIIFGMCLHVSGVYQIYELLSCLLKMEILYWVSFVTV